MWEVIKLVIGRLSNDAQLPRHSDFNVVHWFLEGDSDIRSSNALEDTLTEFKVPGLEIDWACVAWDADLHLNKEQPAWQRFQLRSGTQWQNINKVNKPRVPHQCISCPPHPSMPRHGNRSPRWRSWCTAGRDTQA